MQRGRPSAASRHPVIPGQRIAPPEDLDEFEREQWEQIVSGLPPGWIQPEHVPLLRQYVRHVKVADHLNAVLSRLLEVSVDWGPLDPKWGHVRAMLKAVATETDHMISCAKSLRLTKQATTNRNVAKVVGNKLAREAPGIKPWMDWREPTHHAS
jgi:hypothetical protein